MSELEHEQDEGEATERLVTPDDVQDEELAEDETHEAETGSDEPAAPLEAVGPSPEEWEERFKKVGARFKTYTRAVGTILEEDATDLLPCPLCSDMIPGFVNGRDAGHVADETVGAVQTFIGYEAPASLNRSRLNETCVTCGGLGELETGSRVPQYATRVCDECRGFGYRGPGNPMDAPGAVLPPLEETPNGPPAINLEAALASIRERNEP